MIDPGMVLTQSTARSRMNDWGARSIPFLFIVDFEMKAIRLFRLDQPLPEKVMCTLPHRAVIKDPPAYKPDLSFSKHPMAYTEYEEAFLEIRKHILAGNSFLANLTFPTPVETNLTLKQLFYHSQAPYKLLLDGEFVCFSPESFISIQDGRIFTFPMKGTINASLAGAEQLILSSSKETAEHHTVVDLLRNDLSRVATDVQVSRFRYIDRITTHEGVMLQVSSEITGKLPDDYQKQLGDILFAMLPAGSVTGAPKAKTLEIIRQVENTDRGYYTGIFGIFDGSKLESAVMIRFIENDSGRFVYKSGGGITFLSDPVKEYEELISKVYVPVG